MSFDRFHDARENDRASDREPRPVPGLGQARENREAPHAQDTRADQPSDTRSRAELAAEVASLGRANGELASEVADLYKRIDTLQAELKSSRAETKFEQDKFRAWAKEMSNREAQRALQDQARNKREEALTDRITELERRDTGKTAVADSGSVERWIGGQETARAESKRQEHGRNRPSNEVIAVGVAWTTVGLSILGELKGLPGLGTATSFAAEGIAVGAAHVALHRKHREARNGDRSQG